jgi:hypothetical protein
MVVYETSDISREGRRGKPKNTLSPRIQATGDRTESEILASLNLYAKRVSAVKDHAQGF